MKPRWPPLLVSAQSWGSYEKIEDCEESKDVKTTVLRWLFGGSGEGRLPYKTGGVISEILN